ncbi:hypothetical protein JT359_06045 [Candidatus Poribacteria bacterium]|nr:hypothetical protein [Candidatus Poribacteria bacterium]
MLNRLIILMFQFMVVLILSGCAVILSEQEWSENYALMDGTTSTSLTMIDGDLNTVGEARSNNSSIRLMGQKPSPEVIITLPEKKFIRKVIIHTDNVKKFNLYADKSGSTLSKPDWHLLKEEKSVKNGNIIIPIMSTFPSDKIRIVVLGTTDDAALTRETVAKLERTKTTRKIRGST